MELVAVEKDSPGEDRRPGIGRTRRRRSRRHRRIEPYAWLAAGAVSVGIAASLTGAGVAYADDATGTASSTTSASASTESPSDSAADDGDIRDDNASAEPEPSDDIPDGDLAEVEDPDSDEIEPAPPSEEDQPVESPAAQRDSSGDDDPTPSRTSETDDETATIAPPPQAVPDEVNTPSDTVDAAAPPVVLRTAATYSVEIEDAGPSTVQTSTSGPMVVTTPLLAAAPTTPAAPAAPTTLVDLLTAFFVRLQRTFFVPTPTARSVQTPGQSAMTGIVGDPLTVGLAVESPTGKYDAGLSEPFQMPDAGSGRTLNVLNYGATSQRSWDNDATAIQKAINAATAGDVVYIPNGTYHVRSTIKLKTGVSLVGQSRDLTVLAGAYWTSPHAVLYAAPGVNNLTLSSFKITKASGSSIKAGVRLGAEGGTEVSRIVVKNLHVEKFQRFGVQLQNAKHVLVEGNIIRNATALGGGGSGYGVIIDQSLSRNNWIKDNEIGPVIRHAILIQENAHHNLVEHNRITGTVSGAIDLHGEDEYSNEIRYNTIFNGVRNGTTVSPNGAGIEVGEYSGVIGTTTQHDNTGPNNWIHHNVVYGYSHGLRIVNNTNFTYIEDNVFYDNLGSGILADLAPLNNLYISRNTIYGNGNGIKLYDVRDAVVQGNTVRDNDTYGIWTNAGVTGYTITGNTVTGNGINVSLGSTNGVYTATV